MTSTMLQLGRTPKSNSTKRQISAQELLTLTDTVFKSGLLRKRGKKLNIGKWPHRFVILTYDTVYVYDNETSKVPKTKFGLIGYNQVARCEFKGQSWCFSVIPADDDFGAVKTFACVGDADRKEWMRAIKNQMYTANSISKPSPTRFLANANDEYTSLEMLVYSPNEGIHTREKNDFDNDDDGDENSNGSLDSSSSRISGCTSNTKRQSTNSSTDSSSDSSSRDYEPCDDKFLVQGPLKISSDTKRRLPKDPPPLPPLDEPDVSSNGNQNSSRPPRYSTVVIEEDNSLYVNLPVFKQSATLESMCTVTDSSVDHTQLMNMLLQKNECGTYLIRKSRKGDQKVIAILSQTNDVKEYKIYGTVDRLTLDQTKFFGTVEELLRHYTEVEPLPKSTQHLKQGFYKNAAR